MPTYLIVLIDVAMLVAAAVVCACWPVWRDR